MGIKFKSSTRNTWIEHMLRCVDNVNDKMNTISNDVRHKLEIEQRRNIDANIDKV
jgi:hypothetical protein